MFSLVLTSFKSSLLLLVTVVSLIWTINVSAEDKSVKGQSDLPYVVIKEAFDLTVDSREANKKQVPVLLFFSMKHCPFCVEVEEDYLKPMLRNAEYENKVIIRKVRIDGDGSVRDFAGKKYDVEDFGDKYNISMVPTLVLVNAKGKQTAPRIVGIANAHYYSGELDQAIDASILKIRTIAKR